ncbi:MAG: indole-3-glycerol phosphate synthase TrpC [Clostridium sp.]
MILDEIISKKMKRVENRKEIVGLDEIKNKAYEMVCLENNIDDESLFNTLNSRKFSIIGEFKKASPSKGIINNDFKVVEIAKVYKNIGINAFSILTEEDYFLGNDKYIKEALEVVRRPVLRKDFVNDIYQVYETKVIGAKAVLLIVAVLKERLQEFYDEAIKVSLTPLVEVHNEEELQLALSCGCKIIGINNRDLKTFKTDIKTTERLMKNIPKDIIVVSESGISSIEDMEYLKELGVKGLLIGELFMRNLENKEFLSKVSKLIGE